MPVHLTYTVSEVSFCSSESVILICCDFLAVCFVLNDPFKGHKKVFSQPEILSRTVIYDFLHTVPDKMRLQMVIGMEIEFQNGHHRFVLKRLARLI